MSLDISADVESLTRALVDLPSESRHESDLADLIEDAVRALPWLEVQRHGNTVVARTPGDDGRVVLAGHIDTVPAAGNLPGRIEGERLYGLGACDMKGGVAVGLRVAATVPKPNRPVTFIWYDCEEIDAAANGLGRLGQAHPDLLAGEFAVLLEPSSAGIEAGCQGTLRAEIRTTGQRAHSARSWLGQNAIHRAAEVLARLAAYEPRRVAIDGLEFREGLSAVGIRGGVAGNVIPDECVVTVNYRFAPDRDADQAAAHLRDAFTGFEVQTVDAAAGALPGLTRPAAAEFVAIVGTAPAPKLGWTDVARFSALGVPAVNFGPGDPSLAHTVGEYVELEELRRCERIMRDWLA